MYIEWAYDPFSAIDTQYDRDELRVAMARMSDLRKTEDRGPVKLCGGYIVYKTPVEGGMTDPSHECYKNDDGYNLIRVADRSYFERLVINWRSYGKPFVIYFDNIVSLECHKKINGSPYSFIIEDGFIKENPLYEEDDSKAARLIIPEIYKGRIR